MSFIKEYMFDLEAVLEAEIEVGEYDIRLDTHFDIGHVCELMNTYTQVENFGKKAVKDVYDYHISLGEYSNFDILMELALALYTKAKEHYKPSSIELALLYAELLLRVEAYAKNILSGDELSYFFLYKRGFGLAFLFYNRIKRREYADLERKEEDLVFDLKIFSELCYTLYESCFL